MSDGSEVVTIYFIRAVDCGRIKIGYTEAETPDARLNGMRTGCPSELEVVLFCPGPQEREQEIHRMLRREHVRGEWFLPSERVLSLIGYAKEFNTTDGWHNNLDPLEVALRGGGAQRTPIELDNIWTLVRRNPPEEQRGIRKGQSFEELVADNWRPIAIGQDLAVTRYCSGRRYGCDLETKWVDRVTERAAFVSRGVAETALEIAAADRDELAVAAVWVQAALRHCLGRRQDLIVGQIPEAEWLEGEAAKVRPVNYHQRTTETLPIDMALPFRAVLSAAEFIRHVALVQAATAARIAIMADYTVWAFEELEKSRAA